MQDITRIFESYCNDNGIGYHYGDRVSLNLLRDKKTPANKPYFLHNKNTRNFLTGSFGSRGVNFVGDFFLVVRSSLDMPYFKEVNDRRGDNVNKYERNIEPLLDLVEKFLKSSYCADLTINSFSAVDAVNILDTNFDGLYINYSINV